MKTLVDRTHIPEDIKPAVRKSGARAGKLRRRLAAVLGADILGYSTLIGRAEEQVHRRVGDELERVCREAEKSQGRIFTYAGDSLMVEFTSAVEALRCAMRVQESAARRNVRLAPHDRILFRIGLNTGEVVVQGDRIGGTTVNVAARLESIAEPGGIALSVAVLEQVQRTVPAQYELIGERRLKNIRDPVTVYALPAAAFAGNGVAPAPPRADAVTMPQDFARQPAIAVLPLRCFSAEDEPFTDALTEELINALSRWRSFPVIARNSVFAYRGRDTDVRVIGAELGARYIVSGSVRRHGARVRVTLGLVDAETAENLLSEQYDRESSDPFMLQDELVRAIAAGVLAPEVLKLERARAVQRPALQPDIYDLYARAMWHQYRNTREGLEQAEVLFRQALDIDPTWARATTELSLCRNLAAISRWVPDVAAAHAESLVLARRAVADDPRDPHAHFALGIACMNNARRPEAMDELREAIRLHPSHSFAHANLGHLYNYLDLPDRALPQIELALRLNPHDPRRFMWLPYLAASHYLAGRYRECLSACEQALTANPGYPHAARYMLAALGQLRRAGEARQLLPLMRQFDSGLTGSEAVCRRVFVPAAADRIVEGWRLAGFT